MSRFQWFRRLLGGEWYYMKDYCSCLTYWKRRKPKNHEILIKREKWSAKYYGGER